MNRSLATTWSVVALLMGMLAACLGGPVESGVPPAAFLQGDGTEVSGLHDAHGEAAEVREGETEGQESHRRGRGDGASVEIDDLPLVPSSPLFVLVGEAVGLSLEAFGSEPPEAPRLASSRRMASPGLARPPPAPVTAA